MPISYPPRPTFLLRRTLEWLGGASPLDFVVPTATGLDDVVRTNAAVKEWWSALEPLILVLTLAGYECPEIVVVKAGQARGYLRLPVWEGLDTEGLISHKDVNWAPATGVTAQQLGGTTWAATLLRVTVRRTIDTPVRRAGSVPPRYTPLPLAGPLPAIGAASGTWPRYAQHTDPGDHFADPADGWIVFPHVAGTTEAMRIPKQLAAAAVGPRDAVVDALVAASAGVGIVAALDPATWSSALDRSSWVWPFDALVSAIWAATGPAGLRTRLKLPIEDKALTFKAMADSVSAPLDAELGGDSRTASVTALRERSAVLGLEDATLQTLLASLDGSAKHRHWILTLLALHDAGVIRVLPLPLDVDPGIAYTDMTGWYEAGYDNFNQPDNACLQLNQAGHRLIGWLQDGDLNRYDIDAELVSYDPADDNAPLAYAVSGAGPGDVGTIDLIARDDPTELGVRVQVLGTSSSQIHTLVRRHRYALIPPPALAAALGGRTPADFETQCLPLHSRAGLAFENARSAITRAVADMRVLVDRTGWDDGAMSLANELKGILGDAGVLRFEVEYDANNQPVTRVEETKMARRFRLVVQQALRGTTPALDDRDVLSRLREITTWVETDVDAISDIALLSTIVGIAPAPHFYGLNMVEIGPTADVDIVFGFWAGQVALPTMITHSARCAPPGAPQPHDWYEIYAGVMAQAGIGVSSDVRFRVEIVTVSTGNELMAALEWLPQDFVGSWFVLAESAVEASVYPGAGAKAGFGAALGKEYEAYTFFSRDKGWATGQGDGDFMSFGGMIGASVAGPWSGPVGVGWNILGGKVGVLLARLGIANPPTPPPPPPPPTPLPLSMTVERTVGFAFDSAELSEPAMADLAGIVARHRQLFELPNAHLEIEGDASPPGTDPYNDRLSWERAMAVYGYVLSLLSVPASIDGWWGAANAMAVRDNRIELLGNGEMKARYSQQQLPNQDWQRCKLAINGQVMVLL